ncbi:hypothetical protein Val02_05040 [Virgisporangium aliadipatigenens]|uniref:VWA containing CoxE family protein n=1 Tax=Virgisporangium aliadipatigenens TaxID=741659 RepID=A0A8J4DNI8_9ACTN|nr:VWA domain-containing protein [Virgisporangium aliadipatigenens]GIJ43618.1 hypothetical protein Val02_05040 [Virgisporangium aliadipatigenens]
MTPAAADQPFFLWTLFQQLRRRGFPLGPNDYETVRTALRVGFGLASRDDLRAVVIALWASSREEAAVVAALFDQHVSWDWEAGDPTVTASTGPEDHESADLDPSHSDEDLVSEITTGNDVDESLSTTPVGTLPTFDNVEVPPLPYEHVFLPQYPVDFRSVAQAWRRLRWPIRYGPATELDIDATVRRRCTDGVVSPPVLRPRQRNRANVLLLVDRHGSMTPFHSYVRHVCGAIRQVGRLHKVGVFYFHDTPLEGTDPSLLSPLSGELFPRLDAVLPDVPPLVDGILMQDEDLSVPIDAAEVFADYEERGALVVLSDGGAARGGYDPLRLLDTVAFLKGTRRWTNRTVWLNPLSPDAWTGSTAAETARHVPMFPMDRTGMYRAVDVLRGQPATIERPLTGLLP